MNTECKLCEIKSKAASKLSEEEIVKNKKNEGESEK